MAYKIAQRIDFLNKLKNVTVEEEGKIYNIYSEPNGKYVIFDLIFENSNSIKVYVRETPLKEFLDSLNITTLKKGMEIRVEGKIKIYEQFDKGNSTPYVQIVAHKLIYKSNSYFEPTPKENIKPIPILKDLPAESIAVITGKNNKGFNDFKDQLGYVLSQKLMVREVSLQGDKGINEIAKEIDILHDFPQIELICIVRGGGDDLNIEYVFNSEVLYNTILSSEIPILIAVGHLDDRTYADYASDAPEIDVTDTYGRKQRLFFSVPAILGRYLKDLYYKQNKALKTESQAGQSPTTMPQPFKSQSPITPNTQTEHNPIQQANNDYSRLYQMTIFILLIILAYLYSQKPLP